jgi:hypothetical protein
MTLLPDSTKRRVDIFASSVCAGGVGLGVADGTGVWPGVGVGVPGPGVGVWVVTV